MPPAKRLNGASAIDETEPLLAPLSEPVPSAAEPELQLNLTATPPKGPESEDDDDRPLPVAQIVYLCYVRLVEPIAFFSVFVFLNQMIWEIGDIEKEGAAGFYSGLVGSLFSLAEMLLMIPWGRASDRVGRKPILIISLTGVGLATGILGFGQAIWQLVLFRCLAGFFAATIVTVRTMISENSTPKTQARAFSYFSVSGNIGILVGPLIGGALAEPAKQYPSVFGGIKFFEDFPYALPTIITGCFGLSAALVATFFIKETLGTKQYSKSGAQEKMTIRQLLNFPGVLRCLYVFWHLNLLSVVYTSVLPVFWFTPVSEGGLGFSPLRISIFMAGSGFSQIFWMLVVFPPLHKRIGSIGVLRVCSIIWPFLFALCPFANFLLRQGYETTFWCLYPALGFIGLSVSMAFTCAQLIINDISPSSDTLGTLNAISLATVSAARTVIPALFTSIFAYGSTHQILWGYFVWIFEILVALGLSVALPFLPKEAYGKQKSNEE